MLSSFIICSRFVLLLYCESASGLVSRIAVLH
jgi:hypothetical protein